VIEFTLIVVAFLAFGGACAMIAYDNGYLKGYAESVNDERMARHISKLIDSDAAADIVTLEEAGITLSQKI
jgi:hypothetical protein